MRFKEDKLAIAGGVAVLVMVVLAISAPLWVALTGHPPDQQFNDRLDAFGIPLGPDGQFWLGADDIGRDLLVRIMYGARISLWVAVAATGVEVFIGVTLGVIAGYRRGAIDTILSRLMDLVLSIPYLLLGIAIAVALLPSVGARPWMVMAIIAFFGWPYIGRIVRGQVLSLRESQFVEAARSVGAPASWIMFREILPNLVAPVLTYATLIIPVNILFEAALSFLGVGIQEPMPAWGTMLSRAVSFSVHGDAWWYMVYPGLALFITVLGFNLLGDGLRDALDPRTGR